VSDIVGLISHIEYSLQNIDEAAMLTDAVKKNTIYIGFYEIT
jgi:hypothetical protein